MYICAYTNELNTDFLEIFTVSSCDLLLIKYNLYVVEKNTIPVKLTK